LPTGLYLYHTPKFAFLYRFFQSLSFRSADVQVASVVGEHTGWRQFFQVDYSQWYSHVYTS